MAYRNNNNNNGNNNNNNKNRKSAFKAKSNRKNANQRAGRNRRRRFGRRSMRGRGMFYVETFSFNTAANVINITVKNLANRPGSSNFRVRYIQAIASISSPANVAIQPATIDLRICNSAVNDGSYVAATGPVLLGVNPKSVKVHTPRSSDWLAYNEADTVAVGSIVIGCLQKGATTTVSGLCHVLVDFGPEMLPNSCPALTPIDLTPDFPTPGPSGVIPGPSGNMTPTLSSLELNSDTD